MQNLSKVEKAQRVQWPDLSRDQRAWELAKVALGPNAPLAVVIARAQEIKNTL